MYMDLVLGVYNKVLLQDSCVHEWPLGKFPHSQLCCRHIGPSPYNDSPLNDFIQLASTQTKLSSQVPGYTSEDVVHATD